MKSIYSRVGKAKISPLEESKHIEYNSTAKNVGLQKIGTHKLRKTFGYWHYKQYKDVVLLQEIFNHSASSVTLRYIGINEDIKSK